VASNTRIALSGETLILEGGRRMMGVNVKSPNVANATNSRTGRLFVGVDVHKDNHAAMALDCFGEVLENWEIGNEYGDFVSLVDEIEKVAGKKDLVPVFGLEDTYGAGDFLAKYLFGKGHEIKTVNPVLVKRERDFETHPEKSDLADAKGVAKVLIQRIDTLPHYNVTKTIEISRDMGNLVKDRETIVFEQTILKNQLHRILHQSWGSAYRSVFKDVFSKQSLIFWSDFPSAIECKKSHKRVVKPDWIRKTDYEELPQTSGITQNQVRRKTKRILAIREELKEIETELKQLLEQTGQKLETLPGCGTTLASVVISEIKDVRRFKTPAQLAKYAGLAPRSYESGKKKRHIKSKSGNRRLNRAIYQIALTQISNQGIEKAKEYFQKKIGESKSKKHALTCLKRQIIDIIWSMLKEKRGYYP